MVRHSLNYVSWKQRRAVAADLRTIYTTPTAELGAIIPSLLSRAEILLRMQWNH